MVLHIKKEENSSYEKAIKKINDIESSEITAIIVENGLAEGNIIKFLKSYKDKSLLSKTIVLDDIRSEAYNNIDKDFKLYAVLNTKISEEELNEIVEFIENDNFDPNKAETYEKITMLLKKMGISPSVNGFQYLRKAIYETYRNPRLLQSFTKTLYPMISRKYSKNVNCIERSMRSAIETGWLRSDYELSEKLFNGCLDYEKSKPTNGEFIATMVDELNIMNDKFDL